jgi:hypothetical protein
VGATVREVRSQRRAKRGLGLAFAVGVALAASAPELRAEPQSPTDEETKPFRVVFASTTSCRDPGEFVEQLQRRTGRLRVATSAERALTFQIALSATPAGVEGELRVVDAEGGATTRQVPGLDCHEVISAMALIGALMVDPLAAAMAPPSPPRAPVPVAPPPPSPAPVSESQPSASTWSYGAGQRLTFDSGVAPDVQVGAAAFVELGYALSEPWSLRARLSARSAANVAAAGELASAEFTWNAVRLAACPLSLRPVAGLTLAPCASFELGWLHAAGFDIEPRADDTELIPSAGAELAAAFQLVGPLTIGGELGVLVHLSPEHTFYFDPRQTPGAEVFTLPSVGISGGIGLALSFP